MGRDDQTTREGRLAALSQAEHVLRASSHTAAADDIAALANEIRADVEFRIEYADKITYSRTPARATLAALKGRRVWKRIPERKASQWSEVTVTVA